MIFNAMMVKKRTNYWEYHSSRNRNLIYIYCESLELELELSVDITSTSSCEASLWALT